MINSFTRKILKKMIIGSTKTLNLVKGEVIFPETLDSLGLYLHVPFCKTICPYCPYNKVLYDPKQMKAYAEAVRKEIELYRQIIKDTEITSLYIGGGTPTLDCDILCDLINLIKENFNLTGDICVESHPSTVNSEMTHKLREVGVNKLSIGIESLTDSLLKKIGRSHDSSEAIRAITTAVDQGFTTVNVDMMFALPGQTKDMLKNDVEKVIELGVDQISSYPLYAYPFTNLGKKVKDGSLKIPNWFQKYRLFKKLEETCFDAGLLRTSVWTFTKSLEQRYSSVTRERYIGLGPGAGSYIGSFFYLNTFSLEAYIDSLKNRLPIAVRAPFDVNIQKVFWTYWKVYRTRIPTKEYEKKFEEKFTKRFRIPISLARILGMCYSDGDDIIINSRGSYWVHQIQTLFSFGGINTVWGSCKDDPWPSKLEILR